MKLEVKLFARARDLAGSESIGVELPEGASVADLRSAVGEICPALRPILPALHVAVGTDYAGDATRLFAGDSIACFPPVSGG